MGLAELLEASHTNPSIVAQEQLLVAAGAVKESAQWQYYPTPTFSVQQVQSGKNDFTYQGDNRVLIVGLQQPLWTGGKLDAGLAKAEHEQQSALSALAEAKQDIYLRIITAYAEWLAAHLKYQASAKNISTHEQLYARIERRVREGVSAESDLTLALSRLQQAQADQYNALIQQQASLAQISQLIGQPLNEKQLKVSDPVPIPFNVQESLNLSLKVHPSIQKLMHIANANLEEVKIQTASFYPDVFVKIEKQQGNFQIAGQDSDARFFIGVQSKLGAGLSNLSNVEQAKAKYQASLSDIEKTKRTVTEQVIREWTNAHNLDRRLQVLKHALVSSQSIQQAYDRQFVSGKKSWLDVMNAARELAQTETQLADATGGLLASSWRLGMLTTAFSLPLN
jgi:adhesin transport system outer membrane protein